MNSKLFVLSLFQFVFLRFGECAELFDVSHSKYPEIDKLLYYGKKEDKIKAYNLTMELNNKEPNNPDVLYRLAKACHCMYDINRRDGNKEASETYILKGIEYAKKAMEQAPNNSNTQKWFGITTGANGQFQSLKEKIKCGVVLRDQMNKAIQTSPNDFTL
uniref:Regulator of microtubule dynamics protein 1 n=1 Tax=Cacopsylla melanoneura TaxID=428564 RepID=A0A8D8UGB9_9HEMI